MALQWPPSSMAPRWSSTALRWCVVAAAAGGSSDPSPHAATNNASATADAPITIRDECPSMETILRRPAEVALKPRRPTELALRSG